jgi:hypothetical protein
MRNNLVAADALVADEAGPAEVPTAMKHTASPVIALRSTIGTAAKPTAMAAPLEVFVARAEARACLVRAGDHDLHQGVDVLRSAAVQTGLVGAIGQDRVQGIITAAFAAVREPPIDARFPDPVPETAPGIRAAASTVEALMFSLCQRGAAALAERSCQSRLAELSTAQIRGVIERLIAARPRFRAINDELLFLLGEQLT